MKKIYFKFNKKVIKFAFFYLNFSNIIVLKLECNSSLYLFVHGCTCVYAVSSDYHLNDNIFLAFLIPKGKYEEKMLYI